jgi:hypothetical protein
LQFSDIVSQEGEEAGEGESGGEEDSGGEGEVGMGVVAEELAEVGERSGKAKDGEGCFSGSAKEVFKEGTTIGLVHGCKGKKEMERRLRGEEEICERGEA